MLPDSARYPEYVRFLPILICVAAIGQSLHLEPANPKQGDVIRVTANAPATSARMDSKTIRLFPQASGERLGLMPVAATREPGSLRVETLDGNGKVLESATVTIADARFMKQDVKLQPEVQGLKPSPGEVETVAAFRNTVSDVRYWQEPFAAPVGGCMSSPYGFQRLYNGKPGGNIHSGLDQRSPAGNPIHVMADGVVRLVREYNIHGHVVGVDHGQGLVSIYLHMSKFAVAEGAAVKKGDVIGYVGSTGRSTGPHLHWSVMANGVAVNPTQWISVHPCAPRKAKAVGQRTRSKKR